MKNIDELVAYVLAKPGAEETYPWGDGELVAKVGGKGFAFIGIGADGSASLKFGEDAEHWRQRYPEHIAVAAYIGRFGWNTVKVDGTVPEEELCELVDGSYRAIVSKLPKSKRPADWEA